MSSFENSVTGEEIARALRNDPEKFGHCLAALAERGIEDVGHLIAEYQLLEAAPIVTFLRELATQIEEEGNV